MKILVLPDIHGRPFWRKPCEDIGVYDEVVFLGDYLDPYDFEHISTEQCITGLLDIVALKKQQPDKVHLLLGNHKTFVAA